MTRPFIFILCPAVLFTIPLRDTVLCIPSCLCGHGYTGVHCKLDIDFCSGHQCSEHAVCLDQQHNYTCHCMLGYEGTFCELETDECKSAPCTNSATCIDLVAGYQCLCAPGFKGKLNVFSAVLLRQETISGLLTAIDFQNLTLLYSSRLKRKCGHLA